MARNSFESIRRSCTTHPLHHRTGTPNDRPCHDRSAEGHSRSWLIAVTWFALCLTAQSARGQIINTVVGPTFGLNYVDTLYAYSANSNYASPCPWVTAGWSTWMMGGGGGGQSWSLNWASGAAYTNSLAGLSITEYGQNGNSLPAVTGGTVGGAGTAGGWVVSRPVTTQPNGLGYPAIPGPFDAGGQEVYISYAPTAAQIRAGAPTIASVMWLQAYSVTASVGFLGWSGANSQLLDNGALPWNAARNQATPWYPTAADLPAGTTAMADAPLITAPAAPFTYNDQFQTFIATDTPNFGGVNNYITVYGGVSWGFLFTAGGTPEPSDMCFAGAALLSFAFVFLRRRRGAQSLFAVR